MFEELTEAIMYINSIEIPYCEYDCTYSNDDSLKLGAGYYYLASAIYLASIPPYSECYDMFLYKNLISLGGNIWDYVDNFKLITSPLFSILPDKYLFKIRFEFDLEIPIYTIKYKFDFKHPFNSDVDSTYYRIHYLCNSICDSVSKLNYCLIIPKALYIIDINDIYKEKHPDFYMTSPRTSMFLCNIPNVLYDFNILVRYPYVIYNII